MYSTGKPSSASLVPGLLTSFPSLAASFPGPPSPSFPSLAAQLTVLEAMGSWAGRAWVLQAMGIRSWARAWVLQAMGIRSWARAWVLQAMGSWARAWVLQVIGSWAREQG